MQAASDKVDQLARARQAVMRSVPSIYKGSRHQQGWSYAGEADILEALQPAMVEHGLDIAPVAVETHVEPGQRDGWTHTSVVVTYRMTHTSGQWMLLAAAGGAVDKEGRDAAKAMTSAYKSVLTQAFCVATTDSRQARQNERPPQRSGGSQPQDTGVDPGWASHRDAVIRDIEAAGTTLGRLSAFLKHHGRPLPKQMDVHQLEVMIQWLRDGGVAAVNEHAAEAA